ncbi:MAG: hypothetical protein RLY31_747 [Bacteroidota bacterium]
MHPAAASQTNWLLMLGMHGRPVEGGRHMGPFSDGDGDRRTRCRQIVTMMIGGSLGVQQQPEATVCPTIVFGRDGLDCLAGVPLTPCFHP